MGQPNTASRVCRSQWVGLWRCFAVSEQVRLITWLSLDPGRFYKVIFSSPSTWGPDLKGDLRTFYLTLKTGLWTTSPAAMNRKLHQLRLKARLHSLSWSTGMWKKLCCLFLTCCDLGSSSPIHLNQIVFDDPQHASSIGRCA